MALTPEQEARHALGHGVDRSDLSSEAQAEYDRLEPVREKDRPARVARQRELTRARAQGSNAVLHRVDKSGTTHTFRFQRGRSLTAGIVFLFMGVLVAVAGVAGPSAQDTASRLQSAGLAGLACILCVWLGIRHIRLRVIVRGRKLIIRNPCRTYTVDVGEIREITLERKVNPGGVDSLVPRVHLTAGRSVWLFGCYCGPAGQPPKPELISALAELCALIGIDPPCAAWDLPWLGLG